MSRLRPVLPRHARQRGARRPVDADDPAGDGARQHPLQRHRAGPARHLPHAAGPAPAPPRAQGRPRAPSGPVGAGQRVPPHAGGQGPRARHHGPRRVGRPLAAQRARSRATSTPSRSRGGCTAGSTSAALPDRRVVIEFDYQGADAMVIWLVLDRGEPSVCTKHPGFDSDVVVTTDPVAFMRVFSGIDTLADARRNEHRGDRRPAGAHPWLRALVPVEPLRRLRPRGARPDRVMGWLIASEPRRRRRRRARQGCARRAPARP